MKLTTATLVTGLLAVALNARAGIRQGDHRVSLSLGAANAVSYNTVDGDREEFGDVGPALGFGYLYQVRPHWSLGADVSFKSLGDKDFNTGRGPGEIESSAWTLLAVGRGDPLPDGDIRPYGLLGLGLGRVKREIDFDDSRYDRSQTSGGAAVALGAGLDVDLTEAWLAGAELRYNLIGTDRDEIGSSSVRIIDLMFKVGYKF